MQQVDFSKLSSSATELSIQSVLYRTPLASLIKSIQSIGRATDLCIYHKYIGSASLNYGDCSEHPVLSLADLEEVRQQYAPHLKITYTPFRKNLGSARGHNQIMSLTSGDAIIIQNPDVIPAPDAYIELFKAFSRGNIGLAEARQVPIEHPKTFAADGETSWASTACALIPRQLLTALNGFDADSFFLYCDDVDLSWRVRLAGYKIAYQPSAAVFHDKGLSVDGRWQAGAAEAYYSAEASLLMAHKWSRPKLVDQLLAQFEKSSDPNLLRAASEFKRRLEAGELAQPIDADNKIGTFTSEHLYAEHRFKL